jgi:molecular chaperone HscB
MTSHTDTSLCISCGKPAAQQLACSGCGVVQPLSREPDYFTLFSLPRQLGIDTADLERRYYALSRTLHPDLFHGRPPAEQQSSLRATALVNRAYRTLRDETQRALYWLKLHGDALGRDNERVPPALAARVFEVQEALDELREARRSGAAAPLESVVRETRAALAAELAGQEERLRSAFAASDGNGKDPAASLAELKRVLAELHYLRTLVRDVDKELEPTWTAS